MKKFFTLFALAIGALSVSATDYTDVLSVDVNGNVSEQTATIGLTKNADNSYTFSLKNFALVAGSDTMYIGTIELNGVEGNTDNGVTTLYTAQTTKIKEGDKEGVDIWMGTMLPEVPIVMTAKEANGKLYAAINIDMTTSIGQKIQVVFGDGGFQLPNAGFENFYTYSVKMTKGYLNVDEPLSWHSFASGNGKYLSAANVLSSNAHTFISSETRPGTSGQHSVLVVSSSVFGVVANGTITTGRMHAGSMTTDSPDNHAEIDFSQTEKDGNGDPFYANLNGRPDSLAVWVKYKQGSEVKDYPYATISAAITDGTYYQDPQPSNADYKNVLATAKNDKIESNGFAWQRIVLPFNYVDDQVEGKAILVTISTNAGAGKGTTTDTIYVDDIALIYNATLASATVGGKTVNFNAAGDTVEVEGLKDIKVENIETNVNGKAATTAISLNTQGDDLFATIKVTSNDLKTVNFYSIKFKDGAVSGIKESIVDKNDKVKAIYDINGQKVETMQHGGVYILLHESGKAEKVAR